MENPIIQEKYEEAKEKAEEYYKKLSRIWCPALKDHVTFNTSGLRHLIWRGKWPRAKKEQIRRFLLLPHAAKIIQQSQKSVEYRKKEQISKTKWNGDKIETISQAHFWGLVKKIEDQHVTVVLRQIGNGNKHFFSIFSNADPHEKIKKSTQR
jgi:hypothetical protein